MSGLIKSRQKATTRRKWSEKQKEDWFMKPRKSEGVCIDCGDFIPEERLEIIRRERWAQRCVPCQTAVERVEAQSRAIACFRPRSSHKKMARFPTGFAAVDRLR